MKTKRKLYWDPVKERFKNDDEGNAGLQRIATVVLVNAHRVDKLGVVVLP
jgi:hypothetical protein